MIRTVSVIAVQVEHRHIGQDCVSGNSFPFHLKNPMDNDNHPRSRVNSIIVPGLERSEILLTPGTDNARVLEVKSRDQEYVEKNCWLHSFRPRLLQMLYCCARFR